MTVPDNLRFTKDHEWVRIEGNKAIVGITDFAQSELGDVVFVELPVIGKKLAVNENLAVIESVKAVSDIFAPVAGTVIKANEVLSDAPETVNQDPYAKGWIAEIEMTDPAVAGSLLSASEYEAMIKEGD